MSAAPPGRRAWLRRAAALLGGAAGLASSASSRAAGAEGAVQRGRALSFPRDHGAHLNSRTEWWYLTGWLGPAQAPTAGFQVTFFRSGTGLAADSTSRFAARHLLFAHAAVTDLLAGRHRHAQRIARWTGAQDTRRARASTADAEVELAGWSLQREAGAAGGAQAGYRIQVDDDALAFTLQARRTQPLLLQGDAGFSRKGPEERQASHYYSEPQLAITGTLRGAAAPVAGRAWLDHEWSDEILHPEAVGWDWIGINLIDGGALTAFRLRRADGNSLWAGGSFRPAGGAAAAFGPDAVRFEPGRRWTSPSTAAVYPVQWSVQTPAGRFTVRALLDAQELDGRQGTGTVYWEGLSELLDEAGVRIGLGYLEMTGYASALRLR